MATGFKSGGRTKGTPNKATAQIKELAQSFAPEAFQELIRLAKKADSEQTRVSAIKEIFDRAYGKAPQAVTGEGGEGVAEIVVRWLKDDENE